MSPPFPLPAHLSMLPKHWKIERLKFFLQERDERSKTGSEELYSLSKSRGLLPRSQITEKEARAQSLEGYKIFKPGDIVMNKMQAWNGVFGWSNLHGGIVSPDYTVLTPEESTHGPFLTYMFQTGAYCTEFLLRSRGMGDAFLRLNTSELAEVLAPIPPVDEQLAIASYLDTETKRIDGLIGEKKQLIELLTELRGGVIRERTVGLDRSDSRRETGNQFMPTLPVEWSLVGLGRYTSITNGSTPLKDNTAFWVGGTYPWLNSSVVNGDEVTEGSEMVTPVALRMCHLPIVPAGSVLVALTGQGKTRGQATVLRIEATINQHLAAIVCDDDYLDGEFLFWVLTGQYAALRMVSDGQGGTKGALTCDELGRFPIPKPPIDDQRAIARALYEEVRKIDQLIKHVCSEVEILQELRSATITDAVLGRVDVSDYVKK